MTDDAREAESRGDKARRKAEEAGRRYQDVLEEIKKHFGVLLGLCDRRIEKLETMLARIVVRIVARDNAEEGNEERLDFTVLVIKNSPILSTALVAALQRKFYAFSMPENFKAHEISAEKPDLVLSVLEPPFEDCIETIRQIRREVGEELPIMVLCREEGSLKDLEGLNVHAVLQKPFRLGEVIERIENLCRQMGRA